MLAGVDRAPVLDLAQIQVDPLGGAARAGIDRRDRLQVADDFVASLFEQLLAKPGKA